MHSNDGNKSRRKGPWGFWATLLFGAGILLITYLFTISLTAFYTADLTAGAKRELVTDFNGTVLTLGIFVSVPIILGCIALCIYVRKGPLIRQYIGFNTVDIGTVLRWRGLILLFLTASEFLSQALGRPLLPDFVIETYKTAVSSALFLSAVVIAAPLAEEILFRGFILAGFRSGPVSDGAAVSLSALLWAANHFQYDLFEMILVFLLGVIMGFAKIKTGSIYTPLAMPASVNLLTFIVTAVYLGSDG
ncbi:MAG: type II CAAX endopeptidase family protein [Methylococcales bacterium]|nr:type II CAAX endopeptidase family protein [Methylococcales bacterium]